MSVTIGQAFASCFDTFAKLVSTLSRSNSPVRDQVPLSSFEDELGRFSIWAGNIAAHKTGRASLDFRLRDASPLRNRIAGLLQDLHNLLREAIPLAAGDRKPRDEVGDSDSADDTSDEEESSTAHGLDDAYISYPTTELQQSFLDIVDIVNCLYRLSITIRNAAPHDRLVKAASVDTAYFETWDINHVKNKFPAANEYLSVRLGKAISRRRQYLKYREKHHKKLAQDIGTPQKLEITRKSLLVDKEPAPAKDQALIEDNFNPMNAANKEPEPSIIATTVLTQTTASEFIGANVDLEIESDSGQTQTSYATSVDHGVKLSIPPLPKVSRHGRAFECPYCFTIVSTRNSQSWKKHIFRDLQPYVCTFESCANASKTFDSRHEWFDHELLVHRKEWICSAGCEKAFNIQADFEQHMRQSHVDTFSEHQLAALVDMCQRPIKEDSVVHCSLCMETVGSMRQLCRHLARHLEALALFALPRIDDEETKDGFGSDKVQASDASRVLSEGSLSFGSNSVSGDSVPGDDIYTPGAVSDLLVGFNDSDANRLPPGFIYKFESLWSDAIWGKHPSFEYKDRAVAQLFTDVLTAMATPQFRKLMDSERRAKDMVTMFYLQATKAYQKRRGSHQVWDGLLDRAGALFVRLVSEALDTYDSKSSKLLSNLATLESKLRARSRKFDAQTETIPPSINPEEPLFDTSDDWATHWKIEKADIRGISKSEIDRQRYIHQIWFSEKKYLNGLSVMIRDFVDVSEVVGRIVAQANLVKRHSEHLFESLDKRLNDQGPWVAQISDIFQDWIPQAVTAYDEYAAHFPVMEFWVQTKGSKDPIFKQTYLKSESANTGYMYYMKSPTRRMEQYMSLLAAIHAELQDGDERIEDLRKVINDLESVISKIKSSKARGRANVRKAQLTRQLVLRPGIDRVDLNLDQEGRQLILEGDLDRLVHRSTKTLTRIIPSHLVLLDNFLIVAKPVPASGTEDGNYHDVVYDVSKVPIPMSLLELETTYDSPVWKLPDGSLHPIGIEPPNGKSDVLQVFPFRIKHLGRNQGYCLCARTTESRLEWCTKILEAKMAHAAYLREANAEPFSLRVVTDEAFGLIETSSMPKTHTTGGSPLDQAVLEMRSATSIYSKPRICSEITCATSFEIGGVKRVAIGTKEGFSVSNPKTDKNFDPYTLYVKLPKVQQIYVIDEYEIFFVLASDTLWTYRAELICDYFDQSPVNKESQMKEPPKGDLLAKDVAFFSVHERDDRSLIFLARTEAKLESEVYGVMTSFKILELAPYIYEHSTSPPIGKGKKKAQSSLYTVQLKDLDEFSIPVWCSAMNVFSRNSVALLSDLGGIEIRNWETEDFSSVPGLDPEQEPVRTRISGQRPLGVFRLVSEEYFCCYEECGIYINLQGKLSRTEIIEFVGKASSAAFTSSYIGFIILFHEDFVEVRDSRDGALVQVVAGQDIRCIDDGQGRNEKRRVLMAMAHPDLDGRQLVLELRVKDLYFSRRNPA